MAVDFESLPLRERIKLLLPYAATDPEVAAELAKVSTTLETNPLMGWEPAISPRDGRCRQAEFLSAKEPFKLYAGGNGAGKSNVGTVDDLIQLCDESRSRASEAIQAVGAAGSDAGCRAEDERDRGRDARGVPASDAA
jgi:hypothetical protein